MAYTLDFDDFGGSCEPVVGGTKWPVLSAIRDQLSGEFQSSSVFTTYSQKGTPLFLQQMGLLGVCLPPYDAA